MQPRPRPLQLSFSALDQAAQPSIVRDGGRADFGKSCRPGFDERALQTGNTDLAGSGEGPKLVRIVKVLDSFLCCPLVNFLPVLINQIVVAAMFRVASLGKQQVVEQRHALDVEGESAGELYCVC